MPSSSKNLKVVNYYSRKRLLPTREAHHFLLAPESDEELLSLAASFNEEMETRRQAEAALESKLIQLQKGKEEHEASLSNINERASTLRAALEVLAPGFPS